MKHRLASLVCAVLMLVSVSIPAAALTEASDYFSATAVRLIAKGSGQLLIEYDINATHTMLEVGAKRIYIYEQQSDGNYELVETYYSDDYYDLMMDTNTAFGFGDMYYDGVSSFRYYVLCALYARDEEGSQTLYQYSSTVCAT